MERRGRERRRTNCRRHLSATERILETRIVPRVILPGLPLAFALRIRDCRI